MIELNNNSNIHLRHAIFFACLFLITGLVSLVLYLFYHDSIPENQKILWLLSQILVCIRPIFIFKNL